VTRHSQLILLIVCGEHYINMRYGSHCEICKIHKCECKFFHFAVNAANLTNLIQ